MFVWTHRIARVGRAFWRQFSAIPLPRQRHPSGGHRKASSWALSVSRERFHDCLGQPIPVLWQPQRKEVQPRVEVELVLLWTLLPKCWTLTPPAPRCLTFLQGTLPAHAQLATHRYSQGVPANEQLRSCWQCAGFPRSRAPRCRCPRSGARPAAPAPLPAPRPRRRPPWGPCSGLLWATARVPAERWARPSRGHRPEPRWAGWRGRCSPRAGSRQGLERCRGAPGTNSQAGRKCPCDCTRLWPGRSRRPIPRPVPREGLAGHGGVPGSFCSGGQRDSPARSGRGKMAASLWLSGGGERLLRLLRAGRSALGAGLSLPARAGWRHLHGTRELLGEWRWGGCPALGASARTCSGEKAESGWLRWADPGCVSGAQRSSSRAPLRKRAGERKYSKWFTCWDKDWSNTVVGRADSNWGY